MPNHRSRFWLRALKSAALATAVALPASHAFAQQGKIGVAASVQNEVNGSRGGATRPLQVGSDVVTNDRIQTGNSGNAQLLFLDQTTFTIGPKSDVTIDRFVYDPAKKSGNVVLETTRGAFRFISGTQNANNYQIQTPVATIGVRGSMISGASNALMTVVYVGEGKGWVLPNGKPLIDNIPAGKAVIIFADGRVVVTKFDVGQLDLHRLQELLPYFEDLQDSFNIDLNQAEVPPCIGEGCYGG